MHFLAADIDDDALIACAVAGQADLIVSGDAQLLYFEHYLGTRIVSPAEAVQSPGQ